MLKLQCKLTFNFAFVGKISSKLNKNWLWNNVLKKCGFIKKKNNKKLPWPNTFYTSLYLYKLYIEIIKEGQARSQEVYKNKQITEKKWNLVIWYFWLSFFLSNSSWSQLVFFYAVYYVQCVDIFVHTFCAWYNCGLIIYL